MTTWGDSIFFFSFFFFFERGKQQPDMELGFERDYRREDADAYSYLDAMGPLTSDISDS